jgi:ubiquinone/menaquinone biosynthesis C-methylase UbiE
MGLYTRHVLPRFIDLAMKNKDITRVRADWVPHAQGEVLEVGIGTGLNLPFYSRNVHRVYAVEPSPELQKMARTRMADQAVKVEILPQSAEETLPLSDKSIDTVVITWTLCSIADAPRALQQMNRVLKPSGRLIFVEHGRAPDSGVAAWQDRLTPFWRRIAGGCHLNRKIDDLLMSAGFEIDGLQTTYLPGPRPMTYTYQGFARVRQPR